MVVPVNGKQDASKPMSRRILVLIVTLYMEAKMRVAKIWECCICEPSETEKSKSKERGK